jgi:dihydroorotate dehydrogenase
MFKSLIISPPFGNVIEFGCATSVCGTYTLQQRNGMAFRYLKTLRPVIKFGKLGWVNSIGLRNPGLRNLNLSKSNGKILSIAILNQQDFAELCIILEEFVLIEEYRPAAIEANVSCPNAEVLLLSKESINILQTLNLEIIIKIPPSKNYLSIIEYYNKCGVSYFHLFNSFPSKKGGVSGEVIKNYYLYLVHRASKVFGDSIKMIGGGGIQSTNDILRYQEAGASFFSISTLFFHPIKLLKFFKDYENIKLQ